MREMPEAEITINGKTLSVMQAQTLRVALALTLADLGRLPGTLRLEGHLGRLREMLAIIDRTEVRL